jgi:hypothetical protein
MRAHGRPRARDGERNDKAPGRPPAPVAGPYFGFSFFMSSSRSFSVRNQ